MAAVINQSLNLSVPDSESYRHERVVLVNCTRDSKRREFILELMVQVLSSGGSTIYVKPTVTGEPERDRFVDIRDVITNIIDGNQWGSFEINNLMEINNINVVYSLIGTSRFVSYDDQTPSASSADIIVTSPESMLKWVHSTDRIGLDNVLLLIIDGFDECTSKSDQINIMEVLRLLSLESRKPIFAVVIVDGLNETSRNELASILKVTEIMEPTCIATDVKTKLSLSITHDQFRDHLILPWIIAHDAVSLEHCQYTFRWYSFAQKDIDTTIARSFYELTHHGLIEPILGHIRLETHETSPAYRDTYRATQAGMVAIDHCITLRDVSFLQSLTPIFKVKGGRFRYSRFDGLLAVACTPGFNSKRDISRDLESTLIEDLTYKESYLINDYGNSLPRILGTTPTQFLSALEAATIAEAVLKGGSLADITSECGVTVYEIRSIMDDFSLYLGAFADLLARAASVHSMVALSVYSWFWEINHIFPTDHKLPLLPDLTDYPVVKSGGIMLDFKKAGIDMSTGTDVLDILCDASPEMLAKLFSTLEIGERIQNAMIAIFELEATDISEIYPGTTEMTKDIARNFVKYMFRQGY